MIVFVCGDNIHDPQWLTLREHIPEVEWIEWSNIKVTASKLHFILDILSDEQSILIHLDVQNQPSSKQME